jgi:uncharacterized protein
VDIVLSPVQARVLGCLIEKAISTPEYYPLTLNALVAACNQKSNRDPLMTLDEGAIRTAIEGLREMQHLVWQVETAGSRAPKYRHDAATVLILTEPDVAVLCELLVRGPQTLGELRTHAGRLCAFGSLTDVEQVLQRLQARGEGPLVVKLTREPGRREQRYAHLLCGPVAAPVASDASAFVPVEVPAAPDDRRTAELEAKLDALRREFDDLRQQFTEFQRQFG